MVDVPDAPDAPGSDDLPAEQRWALVANWHAAADEQAAQSDAATTEWWKGFHAGKVSAYERCAAMVDGRRTLLVPFGPDDSGAAAPQAPEPTPEAPQQTGLERLAAAGATEFTVVLRHGGWDAGCWMSSPLRPYSTQERHPTPDAALLALADAVAPTEADRP